MKSRRTIGDALLDIFSAAVKMALGTALVCAGLAFLLFLLTLRGDSSDVHSGRSAARHVLKQTGLSAIADQASIYRALHYNTYARDGDETVIFSIENAWEIGDTLWAAICTAPNWQQAQITAADYAQLARNAFWGEMNCNVAPAPDMVFDAWFYRDDYLARYGESSELVHNRSGLPEVFGLNGTPDTLNATFAFYDRETGTFFFHSFDS